jgi:hypothetical protein
MNFFLATITHWSFKDGDQLFLNGNKMSNTITLLQSKKKKYKRTYIESPVPVEFEYIFTYLVFAKTK